MLFSREIRWFGVGPVRPEHQQWLEQFTEHLTRQPQRTDVYLYTDYDGLGCKFRQEQPPVKLELKRRREDCGVQTFGPFTGRLAAWEKWSLATTAAPAVEFPWIPVQKQRNAVKFAWQGAGQVVPVQYEEAPDCGCAAEVTSITVDKEQWWTIGFEAFGDQHNPQQVQDALEATMGLLREHVPSGLDAMSTCDYPEWLRRRR